MSTLDHLVKRVAAAYSGNPGGGSIYPVQVDHGYGEPLAGGTDVMRKLQNRLLTEQGREPRPESPRLAAESKGTVELMFNTRPEAGRLSFAVRRLFGGAKVFEVASGAAEFSADVTGFVEVLGRETGANWKTVNIDHRDEVFVSGFAQGAFYEVRVWLEADGPLDDTFYDTFHRALKLTGFRPKR